MVVGKQIEMKFLIGSHIIIFILAGASKMVRPSWQSPDASGLDACTAVEPANDVRIQLCSQDARAQDRRGMVDGTKT